MLRRFRDNDPSVYAALLAAADRMRAVVYRFPEARLRLNAAQLMAADGLLVEAAEEARLAYLLFERMGVVREM